MSVPTRMEMILPIFDILTKENKSVRYYDLVQLVGIKMNVSEKDKEVESKTGKSTVIWNNVSWALQSLKNEGIINNERIGYWELLEKGKQASRQDIFNIR